MHIMHNILLSSTKTLEALEQAIAVVTADDGAFRVIGDPAALRRWMVTGLEVTCLMYEYETACTTKEGTEHTMQPS